MIFLISAFAFLPLNSVFAVRPFITDDARVTPNHTFLTETSLRLDQNRLQNLTLFALGFEDKLETTIGFTSGFLIKDDEGTAYQLSAAGPLLQLKYIINQQKGKDGFPSVGAALGANPPWGVGSKNFPPPSWSQFGSLIVSKSFTSHPEHLNLHVNFGLTNTQHSGKAMEQEVTWGVGLQYHLFKDIVYGVTEIVSGDPYGISNGTVYQVGLRIFISEQLQLDTTYGSGVWGNPRPGWFVGFGLRVFTKPLW
jgi:hypothetical protein